MTVSLIITTYNWPRALYLCLDSVMQQTVMPSEILVADDGSGISTRDVVRHFQNISPVPVHHIWHEDRGFRVAAIRNKAIAASSGDYVIHVDGDLILQRNFIQDHILFAREGCYVSGSRGIITDRSGRTLVSNQYTYSLTFDTSLLKNRADQNEAILRLVQLCREQNVEWVDNLPLSYGTPFTFTVDDGSRGDLVQEASWKGGECTFRFRKVRPIPEDDDFFENVWRSYRETGNIY